MDGPPNFGSLIYDKLNHYASSPDERLFLDLKKFLNTTSDERKCLHGYFFSSTDDQTQSPEAVVQEPCKLFTLGLLKQFLEQPAATTNSCQVLSLGKQFSRMPLNTEAAIFKELGASIGPLFHQVQDLTSYFVHDTNAVAFPAALYRPRISTVLSSSPTTSGVHSAACIVNGFECLYGFGYFDPEARHDPTRGSSWPARRTLIYHEFRKSENAHSSRWIVVNAQDHVLKVLLPFLQDSCSRTPNDFDPFEAHLIMHYHCLNLWRRRMDEWSSDLYKSHKKSLEERPRPPVPQPPDMPEDPDYAWIESQSRNIMILELERALLASKALKSTLSCLKSYWRRYHLSRLTAGVTTLQESPMEHLFDEQTEQAKSIKRELKVYLSKAQRLADAYSRLSQIRNERYHDMMEQLQESGKANSRMTITLTLLTATFLPVATVTSFFSVTNFFKDHQRWYFWLAFGISITIMVLLMSVLWAWYHGWISNLVKGGIKKLNANGVTVERPAEAARTPGTRDGETGLRQEAQLPPAQQAQQSTQGPGGRGSPTLEEIQPSPQTDQTLPQEVQPQAHGIRPSPQETQSPPQEIQPSARNILPQPQPRAQQRRHSAQPAPALAATPHQQHQTTIDDSNRATLRRQGFGQRISWVWGQTTALDPNAQTDNRTATSV